MFNSEADQAIRDAWPELAVLPGFYPRQVRARAYRLGLRLSPHEAKLRKYTWKRATKEGVRRLKIDKEQ